MARQVTIIIFGESDFLRDYVLLGALHNDTILRYNTMQEYIATGMHIVAPACFLLEYAFLEKESFAMLHVFRRHYNTFASQIIVFVSDIQFIDESLLKQGLIDDVVVGQRELSMIAMHVTLAHQRWQRRFCGNPLTHLPGNTMIHAYFAEQQLSTRTLLYIDIDCFKIFNDTYGFLLGDVIIKHTAAMLRMVVQHYGLPDDFLGHLGGDDFIIFTQASHAELLAKNICSRFDNEYSSWIAMDQPWHLSVSVVLVENMHGIQSMGSVMHAVTTLKRDIKKRTKKQSQYSKTGLEFLSHDN